MNQENILVKIVKQTRKDIDGFYSIALRVMKNRRKKEIQLNLKCKDGEFENQEFTKAYPDYKLHNEFLLKRKTKALKIIREFQIEEYDFTLDEFEDRFKGKKKQSNIRISKVIDYFDKVIAENFEVGKVATARVLKKPETRCITLQETKLLLMMSHLCF